MDNNKKTDIIAVAGKQVYAWEVNSSSAKIEWGRERYNSCNTGEYLKRCSDTIISSSTTWTGTKNLCGDLVVKQGVSLTISSTCTVNLADNYKILLMEGANLVVDGGKFISPALHAVKGSKITIKNNGYLKVSNVGEFSLQKGVILDYQNGTLDIY